jgi:NADH:ubiquinone oxidoreductase subunit F (NADH-binding)/NADH:ubiquinone oxidoreductase subunit E
MDLLDRMMELQERRGAVTDEDLHRLSGELRVPLYRLEGLRGFYPVFRARPGAPREVHVCRDLSCAMKAGGDFGRRVAAALKGSAKVEVHETSCLGRCDRAPAATVNGVPVTGTSEDIADYATGRQRLPPAEPTPNPRRWPTDPYARPEERYGVLKSVLATGDDARRDQVLGILKASGLRGMGGAGFPTAMKWDLTRKAQGSPKYVVCNADESEPGTFKDRVILEQLPHLVVEAMVLAGWMIGARQGIIYLRHEYQPEKKALLKAIGQARAAGALGENLFASGFAFDLRVFVSPGGYILGEETALLEALEDKRGEPRNKPPFPTHHGLWGKPTLINNVETFAAVPIIVKRGADWWSGQGVGESKGLKFLSVSGDVAQPGVYCVPMGTPVLRLLELCGGMAEGKALHAFMPGGASSNVLPAAQAGVALDFQPLQQAGSMLGSGAVVFMAQGRDLARLGANVLRFFRNESCGKCVPCRVGTHKAAEMVDAALAGNPPPSLNERLRELGETLSLTSICGLGQIALQPLLSVLNNFPGEAAASLGVGSGRRPTAARAAASASDPPLPVAASARAAASGIAPRKKAASGPKAKARAKAKPKSAPKARAKGSSKMESKAKVSGKRGARPRR